MNTITSQPGSNYWANSISSVEEPGTVTPSAADLAKAPDQIDPRVFRLWNSEAQAKYVAQRGGQVTIGTPPSAETFKSGDRIVMQYRMQSLGNDGRIQFTKFAPGEGIREPKADEMATAPGDLKPKTFFEWTRDGQWAYLTKWMGSPYPQGWIGGRPGFESITAGALRITSTGYSNVVSESGVIQNTEGDLLPLPYLHLQGTTTGAVSPVIAATAEALFPTIDGKTVLLPVEDRPDGFYTAPAALTTDEDRKDFLKDFAKWHSGYQLEYVKLYGGNDGILRIPTSDGGMTAVVSKTDGTKFFILQALDKAAFAKMSKEDQDRITGPLLSADFEAIAAKVGLTVKSAATVTDITFKSVDNTAAPVVSPVEALNRLIDYIEDRQTTTVPKIKTLSFTVGGNYDPRLPGDAGNGIEWEHSSRGGFVTWTQYSVSEPQKKMPDEDKAYFTKQIEILKEQLAGMSVVSATDISKRISEIKDRFDRAFAFWDVVPPKKVEFNQTDFDELPDGTRQKGHAYTGVVSQNGDLSGIRKGYDVFIAQEARIAELAEERMKLARESGGSTGKRLDVPTLVYKFQSLYNLELEAKVVMETEEVNQQNELLKTYARIQDIVNKTISLFKDGADGERRILDKDVDAAADAPDDGKDYVVLTEEERHILSMFEDVTGSGQLHPLEKLRGALRPTHEIFEQFFANPDNAYDLISHSHPTWSQFGTRLSEAVTTLNQNSQLKMNDINSMDKQRNRHFELANGALSKMNDMLQSIARAG